MKKFVLITLLILIFAGSSPAGWFFNSDKELKQQLQHEQQREQQLEDQFRQEHQHNTDLTGILVVLGIGCFGSFLAGTMIGSKTRRASNEN